MSEDYVNTVGGFFLGLIVMGIIVEINRPFNEPRYDKIREEFNSLDSIRSIVKLSKEEAKPFPVSKELADTFVRELMEFSNRNLTESDFLHYDPQTNQVTVSATAAVNTPALD